MQQQPNRTFQNKRDSVKSVQRKTKLKMTVGELYDQD